MMATEQQKSHDQLHLRSQHHPHHLQQHQPLHFHQMQQEFVYPFYHPSSPAMNTTMMMAVSTATRPCLDNINMHMARINMENEPTEIHYPYYYQSIAMMPALPELHHASQQQQQQQHRPPLLVRRNSDLSSLPFPGSIVPDQHYDPTKDPVHQPFVPPLEISIPASASVEVVITDRDRRESPTVPSDDLEIPSPPSATVQDQDAVQLRSSSNDYSSHRPDWLQLHSNEEQVKNKRCSPRSPCCARTELELAAAASNENRRDGGDYSNDDDDVDFDDCDQSVDSREVHHYHSQSHKVNKVMSPTSIRFATSFRRNVASPVTTSDEEDVHASDTDDSETTDIENNQDGVTFKRTVNKDRRGTSRSKSKKTQKPDAKDRHEPEAVAITTTAATATMTTKSPNIHRKGMVRREFQRRYLWFRRGNRVGKNKSETSGTVASDWSPPPSPSSSSSSYSSESYSSGGARYGSQVV